MKYCENRTLLLSFVFFAVFAVPLHAEIFPLDEYDAQVKKYLSSLENIAVEFSITDHTLDGIATYFDECWVVSIEGHFRAKMITKVIYKDGSETSKTEWSILRPDGYFVISEKPNGEFLLKDSQKDITSPLFVDPTTPLNFLIQPVCNIRRPLLSLLQGKLGKTHVAKVKTFQRNQDSTTKPFTLKTLNEINGGTSESEFELNEWWLINKISTSSGEVRLTSNITYTMLGESMLPAHIAIKRTDLQGRASTPGFVAEFRNYRVYTGSPADFSLRQFGLPEPLEASTIYQAKSVWHLWFITGAVFFIGIGLFYWRRIQRKKMAVTLKTSVQPLGHEGNQSGAFT